MLQAVGGVHESLQLSGGHIGQQFLQLLQPHSIIDAAAHSSLMNGIEAESAAVAGCVLWECCSCCRTSRGELRKWPLTSHTAVLKEAHTLTQTNRQKVKAEKRREELRVGTERQLHWRGSLLTLTILCCKYSIADIRRPSLLLALFTSTSPR